MSEHLPTVGGSSVDLIRDSLEHVVAVVFPKSRSSGYGAALNIARQAHKYDDANINGALFHYAVFGNSPDQLALALAIARYLAGLKGAEFYARGKMIIERHRIESVLSCYMSACACEDRRSHCNAVAPDPFFKQEVKGLDFDLIDDMAPTSEYLMPCTFLTKFGAVKMHKKHPSTPQNQLQALGIKYGCEWCPNFNPGDFKKL